MIGLLFLAIILAFLLGIHGTNMKATYNGTPNNNHEKTHGWFYATTLSNCSIAFDYTSSFIAFDNGEVNQYCYYTETVAWSNSNGCCTWE